jgi:hypothetical protein
MNTKATKLDATTFLYRGFRITRNFTSKHGAGGCAPSQQGFAVTPSVSYGSSSLASTASGSRASRQRFLTSMTSTRGTTRFRLACVP